MSYTAAGFTLFYPEPPTYSDMQAFIASLAPQAMLFWDAPVGSFQAFRGIGRKGPGMPPGGGPVRLILRVPNERLFTISSTELATRQAASGNAITAVLLGNEPDLGLDLRWRRPDRSIPNWGNTAPQNNPTTIDLWRKSLSGAVQALRGTGVTLVSPAFSMQGYTEDDAPTPGLMTWRELLAPLYYAYGSAITGNGVHYYDNGWWEHDPPEPPTGDVTRSDWEAYASSLAGARVATKTNVDRFKQNIRFWSAFHHHEIYLDEANTFNSAYSPAQHMEACVGKSKLLIHSTNALGYVLGERIAMFAPFCSNGLGNAYPMQYIMRDSASYGLVRDHMIEEGYSDG